MEFLKSKRGILVLIIILGAIIFVINKLYESRYGYIVLGPIMKCEKSNYVKLSDGRVSFVGHNMHRDELFRSDMYRRVNYRACPSEIYDPEKNTFEEVNLPEDFYYLDKAVLLKDGKLLFTKVKDLNNPSEISPKYQMEKKSASLSDCASQYGSLAVYNLQTNKIEKYMQTKMNKYLDAMNASSYLTMKNGKVINYNHECGYIEIYDINNNTSELIKIKKDYGFRQRPRIFHTKDNDEVIIITSTENPILKYNDKTKTIQEIGKFNLLKKGDCPVGVCISGEFTKLFRINDDMFLVVGGTLDRRRNAEANGKDEFFDYTSKSIVEIYNIKTERSEIIEMLDVRESWRYHNFMTIEKIDEDNILIASGVKSIFRPLGIQRPLKTTEILNLKTKKFTRGPRMKRKYGKHQAIKLDNGDILISSGLTTQIFKKWKVWR